MRYLEVMLAALIYLTSFVIGSALPQMNLFGSADLDPDMVATIPLLGAPSQVPASDRAERTLSADALTAASADFMLLDSEPLALQLTKVGSPLQIRR